ncbi:MAG TPA: hypothetical protein VIV65_10325 [Gemmatimonadaceae bacterium]|jgi:hypothetical protein
MMRRLLISGAFLLSTATRVSVAQDGQIDPLTRLDLRYRLQIEAVIDSARQAGLPWHAVRSKALQGVSMRVDAQKIVAGVRQTFANLVKARDVLGPLPANDLESGASALSAGIRSEDLALFRPATAGRSPTHALVYLADLISPRHGVPREDAVAAFAKLWNDGAADDQFDGLWRGIDQDIMSGVNPKAALQHQMSRIPPRSVRPPADQRQENPHS